MAIRGRASMSLQVRRNFEVVQDAFADSCVARFKGRWSHCNRIIYFLVALLGVESAKQSDAFRRQSGDSEDF